MLMLYGRYNYRSGKKLIYLVKNLKKNGEKLTKIKFKDEQHNSTKYFNPTWQLKFK
jgi:hypothetical protein